MATIPQVIDQSNYTVERSETQTETPFAAWRRTLARMNTDQIAQLVVDMEARHNGDLAIVGAALCDAETERSELNQGCSWLASQLRYEEADNDTNQIDYLDMDQGCADLARRCQQTEWEASKARMQRDYHRGQFDAVLAELEDLRQRFIGYSDQTAEDWQWLRAEQADLNQGCSDLTRRAQAAEELLFTVFQLTTCDGTVLQNALRRLNDAEHSHDTTKRLLAQLQAEADDLRTRLAASAEQHVSDLAIMGDAYDALAVAHTEAIDTLGRVGHCLVDQLPIGPNLTQQIMSLITKDTAS